MADWLDLFLETHCHCFKVTNPRTNVTEEFLLSYKLSEVSGNFEYLVGACSGDRYTGSINRLTLDKLKRFFGNDFSDFLHHLLLDQVKENKNISSLAYAIAEMPEASRDTILLILEQNLPKYVINQAMEHEPIQGVLAFK